MARRYINGDEVNITKTDFCSVDVEFDNGEKIANVEPKRLFPVSNISNYITVYLKAEHQLISTIKIQILSCKGNTV